MALRTVYQWFSAVSKTVQFLSNMSSESKDILTKEEAFLHRYVPCLSRVRHYIQLLRACTTMREADDIILPMLRNEGVPSDNIAQEYFYMGFVDLLPNVKKKSRSTLFNHFCDMQSRLRRQKETESTAMNGIFGDGVKLEAPKPGEEGHYLVELIIMPNTQNPTQLLMTAELKGTVFRPISQRGFNGEPLPYQTGESVLVRAMPQQILAYLSFIQEHYPDATTWRYCYQSDWITRDDITLAEVVNLIRQELP